MAQVFLTVHVHSNCHYFMNLRPLKDITQFDDTLIIICKHIYALAKGWQRYISIHGIGTCSPVSVFKADELNIVMEISELNSNVFIAMSYSYCSIYYTKIESHHLKGCFTIICSYVHRRRIFLCELLFLHEVVGVIG